MPRNVTLFSSSKVISIVAVITELSHFLVQLLAGLETALKQTTELPIIATGYDRVVVAVIKRGISVSCSKTTVKLDSMTTKRGVAVKGRRRLKKAELKRAQFPFGDETVVKVEIVIRRVQNSIFTHTERDTSELANECFSSHTYKRALMKTPKRLASGNKAERRSPTGMGFMKRSRKVQKSINCLEAGIVRCCIGRGEGRRGLR